MYFLSEIRKVHPQRNNGFFFLWQHGQTNQFIRFVDVLQKREEINFSDLANAAILTEDFAVFGSNAQERHHADRRQNPVFLTDRFTIERRFRSTIHFRDEHVLIINHSGDQHFRLVHQHLHCFIFKCRFRDFCPICKRQAMSKPLCPLEATLVRTTLVLLYVATDEFIHFRRFNLLVVGLHG